MCGACNMRKIMVRTHGFAEQEDALLNDETQLSSQPIEWTPHYEQRLNMMRKGSVRIRAVNSAGEPIPNATISIVQNRLGLSFGYAVESNILEDKNSKTGSLRHSP
ncbi:hypothetical protein F2Q69_00049034 [Brassica cretica]|uniref:Uncharacterized protein n=1 Tax=Brassica cretica TaxID=69181 RepID=A0A8S9PU66_BRACR|nr:hypothetical protein F2Q69_00049034 [Brassica cretica]